MGTRRTRTKPFRLTPLITKSIHPQTRLRLPRFTATQRNRCTRVQSPLSLLLRLQRWSIQTHNRTLILRSLPCGPREQAPSSNEFFGASPDADAPVYPRPLPGRLTPLTLGEQRVPGHLCTCTCQRFLSWRVLRLTGGALVGARVLR
jgi:hypothetical protein